MNKKTRIGFLPFIVMMLLTGSALALESDSEMENILTGMSSFMDSTFPFVVIILVVLAVALAVVVVFGIFSAIFKKFS